jgi:6-pyruvoyltetrahydropterin/6-carboxytetrahydropterin synthase
MYELMIESTFAAAHQVREQGGKCENLHGHTWKVQVFVAGELNELGMVIDFQKIKEFLKNSLAEYDHAFLNELADFKMENPTAENIAKNLAGKIQMQIKNEKVKLTKITVWESATSAATYFCEK